MILILNVNSLYVLLLKWLNKSILKKKKKTKELWENYENFEWRIHFELILTGKMELVFVIEINLYTFAKVWSKWSTSVWKAVVVISWWVLEMVMRVHFVIITICTIMLYAYLVWGCWKRRKWRKILFKMCLLICGRQEKRSSRLYIWKCTCTNPCDIVVWTISGWKSWRRITGWNMRCWSLKRDLGMQL